MEVRAGYKQTEVGVIPEDWEVQKLGACATFRTGPFGSALHKSDYTVDGVPVINPMHIIDSQLVPTRAMSISHAAAKQLSEYKLRANDIIMGRRGDMGRCAVVQDAQAGWLCGTGSIIIQTMDSVEPSFLQRILSSPRTVAAITDTSVGTTMINLNQCILAGVKIQLPPLAEQHAIAEALSDADAFIESLEQLIDKKRQIKHGVMQELLTGKRRLPGFSGAWEEKRFGEVAGPRSERIDPRKLQLQEFCVELEHIGSASGMLLGSTATDVQSSLKAVFRPGDVLFGKLRAYLRKYWLADRSGVCSTECWVLSPKENRISASYLFQVVQTDSFVEAASSSYGTHMPRSDWNVVKNHELLLPPTAAEQNAIAIVLTDMDTEIAALETKLAKARQLKQGMMQELLTGRIRLV